jgi:hypothetical protein
MSRSEVWSLLKDHTKSDPAGKQVHTTLLGDVHSEWKDNQLVGFIPFYLNNEASRHGFRIINANVMNGTYTLEKTT